MKMHSNSTLKKFYMSMSIGDLGERSLVSCLSTFSKEFSSDATGFIFIKFPIQLSSYVVKKICRFGPGHMTIFAALTIYNKNL